MIKMRREQSKYIIQTINSIHNNRQYRISFVTIYVEEDKNEKKFIDQWCVIEAPKKIKEILASRILITLGKIKVLN